MRAAVITEQGATPIVQDFDEPSPVDGAVMIDVTTAGLGAWDILGAYRLAVGFPTTYARASTGCTPST